MGDVQVRDFNTCSEDQSWDVKCFQQNGYKTEELDSNKETHEKIREILITGHPRQEGDSFHSPCLDLEGGESTGCDNLERCLLLISHLSFLLPSA